MGSGGSLNSNSGMMKLSHNSSGSTGISSLKSSTINSSNSGMNLNQ
jgi:hypothetical protein